MSMKKMSRWSVVTGLGLVVGGFMIVLAWGSWSEAQAAPPTANSAAPDSVASRLESLHQRAVTRAKADEDEDGAKQKSRAGKVTPELAAQLATRANGGGRPTWIARRERPNGKGYFEVQVESNGPQNPGQGRRSMLYVDEETADVGPNP
jgi:hypothetical protein